MYPGRPGSLGVHVFGRTLNINIPEGATQTQRFNVNLPTGAAYLSYDQLKTEYAVRRTGTNMPTWLANAYQALQQHFEPDYQPDVLAQQRTYELQAAAQAGSAPTLAQSILSSGILQGMSREQATRLAYQELVR